ncbi:MAG: ABC transporter permease subunit [Candidatus Hydrogenedentota bacterium]|nr:MAG: ABC transporter permease subunit [Candidatus Hydrogenedentota bacterium]
MFHALLWKEWRELWVLPVAAAPLAAMSFFLTKADSRLLTPVVWETAFSMWLFVAAVYVPTHAYAREKEMNTSDFLFSKPLDRFRLWWLKLLAGIVALLAVGVILYGVPTALALFYQKAGSYDLHRVNTVRKSVSMSLFLFGLSSLVSVILRRQIAAVAGVVLLLFVLWMPFGVWHYAFGTVENLNYPLLSSLVLSPVFLFASLLAFAQDNAWRRTRGCVARAYTVSAIAALVPVSLGLSYLSAETKKLTKPSPEGIRVHDVSEDGTRMVLQIYPGSLLVSVDMSERRVNMIDKADAYAVRMKPDGNAFIYLRGSLPPKEFLSDFQGIHKKELFGTGWLNIWGYPTIGLWSMDGAHLGLAKSAHKGVAKEGALVAIIDPTGKILAEHMFPVLEEAWVFPIGWDSESTFYFRKHLDKGYTRTTTYWRVRPDDGVPEQVFSLPKDASTAWSISPDGRWIPYRRFSRFPRRDELWLYDVSLESEHLVSADADGSAWSQDGRLIAIIEGIGEQPEEEMEETPSPRLTVYEPEIEKRCSISLEGLPNVRLHPRSAWSPSSKYLLLSAQERHTETGERIPFRKRRRESYVFSVETGQYAMLDPPGKQWNADTHDEARHRRVMWIVGDRLLWSVANRLVVTQADGSDPAEIFRFEGDTFFCYGEEIH